MIRELRLKLICFLATVSCAVAPIPLSEQAHSVATPPSSAQAESPLTPASAPASRLPKLQVSSNRRFLQTEDGEPFFWLGDTGWLLFKNLKREEAERYLEDRRNKGFNVIQIMLVHELGTKNVYGDVPFIDKNPATPNITPGSSTEDDTEYDYWDHVDTIVNLAEQKGLYLALVPIWGSAAKSLPEDSAWATSYAAWLARRYQQKTHIIWLNGGDIRGDHLPKTWEAMGQALRSVTPQHLTTFHPRGREQSSTWFHDRTWLDFNMFQSGHRRYDQRRESDDPATWKGEDNWLYVEEDYARRPVKPTIDGEPSYENIPQGLHDPAEGYWTAADARRYAYWSVFAGAFGHTYGNNAVMQMHKPDSGDGAFGVRNFWFEAIDDPGAAQMQHLKNLILSRPFFERVPDQSLIPNGKNGTKYDYVIATRGSRYALLYTYSGASLSVDAKKLPVERLAASWLNPRSGELTKIGVFENSQELHFDPPGDPSPGNDWVLILDDEASAAIGP